MMRPNAGSPDHRSRFAKRARICHLNVILPLRGVAAPLQEVKRKSFIEPYGFCSLA
jgi:hypothetical protein